MPSIGILVFLISAFTIKAQDQVYKYQNDGDEILIDSWTFNNKELITAHNYVENRGTMGDYVFEISVFDRQDKSLKKLELIGLKDSLKYAVATDIVNNIKNELIVALVPRLGDKRNNFTPDDYYALLILNEDLSIKKQIIRTIPGTEFLQPQKLIYTSDSTLLVIGSNRQLYTGVGYNWFVDEYTNNVLTNTVISTDSAESERFLGYLFSDMIQMDSNQYYLTADVEAFQSNYGPTMFSMDAETYKITKVEGQLPFSPEAYARINGEKKRAYKVVPRNMFQLNADTLASDFVYHRIWVTLTGKLIDTTTVGMFFYTKELDSLKLVELSLEHGKLSSFTSDLDKKEGGNYCFGGGMDQNPTTGGRTYNGIRFESGIIAMLDDTGKVLWNYKITEEETHMRLTKAVATTDGGCLFIGDWEKEGESQGRDLLIVSMDSLGTLTSISDESLAHLFDKQKIAVYPNPVQNQGKVNLSWTGMQKQNWQVKFYDNQGRLVHATDILQGVSESNIQLPELPSGNYIIRAEGSGKQVHTGTVVVE
jgi:hypothetical protein